MSSEVRICGILRTKTLRCHRPATLRGGYWLCTAGHVVRSGAQRDGSTESGYRVTRKGVRAVM